MVAIVPELLVAAEGIAGKVAGSAFGKTALKAGAIHAATSHHGGQEQPQQAQPAGGGDPIKAVASSYSMLQPGQFH